ncbi:hypothetical protein EDD85DRAFT_952422 [Armillaria nabsnona]|nr:hypothetical protein EDD85DRAFT_952422 [Armillaria nabsnona]
MPLHQWFHHESTVWGLMFHFDYVETTCLSKWGIYFPTSVEDPSGCSNKNMNYSTPSTSPAKSSYYRTPIKKVVAATVALGGGYPTLMGFGDEVLIYDGCASAGNHFLFHPSDFSMLKSLPCYTTSHDLDAFTLVSVGYTLSV